MKYHHRVKPMYVLWWEVERPFPSHELNLAVKTQPRLNFNLNIFFSVCTFSVGMPGAYKKHYRASDTLELDLETVVSPHVGGMNQAQILRKTSQCS